MKTVRNRSNADPRPSEDLAKTFIDPEGLRAFDVTGFHGQSPFPWATWYEPVRRERYAELRRSLPKPEAFRRVAGRLRRFGQRPHDRYVLDYRSDLPVAPCWHEFVAELQGAAYRELIARLLGTGAFRLNFHWHFTPRGCSVSPHCDAEWKLGSHIFYFNTEFDWDAAWGGSTVILDDAGQISHRSAPDFDDFATTHDEPCIGNRSMLFARTDHSWHGVRPLTSPDGALRKVFIVEFLKDRPLNRTLALLGL